jgi:hypothetical protein
MRIITTISIDPEVLKRAKREALKRKTSFSKLIEISLLQCMRS